MVRNCTVGADAFYSENPWRSFTQNPVYSFLPPSTYAMVLVRRGEIGLFPLYRKIAPQLKTPPHPEFPRNVSPRKPHGLQSHQIQLSLQRPRIFRTFRLPGLHSKSQALHFPKFPTIRNRTIALPRLHFETQSI